MTPPRTPAPDQIAAAIAAVDQQEQQEQQKVAIATLNIQLGDGRPAQVRVPFPLTAKNVGEITGFLVELAQRSVVAQDPDELAAAAARQRIVLPT